MNKRLEYNNLELIDKLYEENKDIILVMGHYANWEWLSHLSTKIKYALCLVYKQQRNAYFDYFLYKLRSRYGALPVEMNDAFKLVHANKKKNIRTALVLIADQSPVETKYFTTFLNHAGTPVYEGPERIAKALGMPLVYVDITKKSRGHYKIEFVLLAENPKEMAKGEITEKHVRYLEKKIQKKPEYWLWSHRRWKRTEADYKKK